jgi:ribonuclease HII
VVAAAVVLDPRRRIPGLDDSKKLDEATREALYPKILERALAVGVGVAEPERIDEINILRASLAAMADAFAQCEDILGEDIPGAVVDGNMKAPLPARVAQEPVIGGDGISPPIMAASIVAKVLRDRRMIEEASRFPGYGFERHKGYATPAHREALMRLGPCVIHRRSFRTVREAFEVGGGEG